MLKLWMRSAGLIVILFCFHVVVFAAKIQKKDGQVIVGEIQGTVAIKSTTEMVTMKGKEYAAVSYVLIDGQRILQVDPTDVTIAPGRQTMLTLSWELGSSVQPPSDVEALAEAAVAIQPSGFPFQWGYFSSGAEWAKVALLNTANATINGMFGYPVASGSDGTAPSFYAWPTIGNILGTFTSGNGSLLPTLAVTTSGGVVNLPVEEIVAFVGDTSTSVALSGGGAGTASTLSGMGPLQVGYASVSVESGNPPYGTAVFSFRQNYVVVSEVGVPSSSPTVSGRIFVDFRTGVAATPSPGRLDINTGLAVVNGGTAAANVTYTLRGIGGNVLTVGHGTLAPGAHFAKFIDQLQEIAPDFNLPANFASATGYGSLEITSDQALSILALRLTVNQRGEGLLTSTPIADLTKPLSSAPIYFPQFADGGGYITTILLLNTSNALESGVLNLYDDNGIPLVVSQIGGAPGSSFSYAIPAAGALVFQTDGSPSAVRVGSVRLTPDAGTSTPVGSGLFRFSPGAVVVTESGVPTTTPTTHAHIYVDKSGGHDTGIAIAAPDSAGINVTMRAFQKDGSTSAGQGPATLPSADMGTRPPLRASSSPGWRMVSRGSWILLPQLLLLR